jgi:(S)-sulfolactate dehydrogenase
LKGRTPKGVDVSSEAVRVLFLVPPGPREAILPEVPEGWDPIFVHELSELSDEVIRGARALFYPTHHQLDRTLLQRFPDLQLIQRVGVGVDTIDLEAARDLGIAVANVEGGNATSVAEFVIMGLIFVMRRMGEAIAEGLESKNPYPALYEKGCFEIQGRSLGIVGFGAIGQAVAVRARAMGMELLGASLRDRPPGAAERELGVRRLPFPDLLREADAVTLHVPLNEQTGNLITRRELAMMKKGSYLINTARGGIVDEDDLAASLRSGHLGGAVVDTFLIEPIPPEHPLRGAPNALLTPHSGGNTNDCVIFTIRRSLENIERVLRGEEPFNRV